jgi:hypothetical protein
MKVKQIKMKDRIRMKINNNYIYILFLIFFNQKIECSTSSTKYGFDFKKLIALGAGFYFSHKYFGKEDADVINILNNKKQEVENINIIEINKNLILDPLSIVNDKFFSGNKYINIALIGNREPREKEKIKNNNTGIIKHIINQQSKLYYYSWK